MRIATILYRKLLYFLLENEVEVLQHPSRRVTSSLANFIFNGEYIDEAESVIKGGKQKAPAIAIANQVRDRNLGVDNKIAHNMTIRFKDNDKKFDGTIGQCFRDLIAKYIYYFNNYHATPSNALCSSITYSKEKKNQFYIRKAEGVARYVGEAVAVIEE